jgi:hypothetical protein
MYKHISAFRPYLSKTILIHACCISAIALNEEEKPTQAKVKCLLACFERIVPALKVVEVKKETPTDPKSMTDEEIIEMMERMVDMAQSGGLGRIDGSDPKVHEASISDCLNKRYVLNIEMFFCLPDTRIDSRTQHPFV